MSTHVTSLRDKAGTTEWAIHLWFDNGHEVFAKHEELEATPSLEEAQAAAAARIHHLQQRSLLQGISGTWWGDLQRGIWEPIEHHDGDEVTLDATWETAQQPQWTSYSSEDGQLLWERIQ